MSSFSSNPTLDSVEEPAQRADDSHHPISQLLNGGPIPPGLDLVVAATFTAEPLAEILDFWMTTLGLPTQRACAPYNQVFQQLLDPTSLLAHNQHGVNLLLVRWEDWRQSEHGSAAEHVATPDHYTTIEQHGQQFLHTLKAVAEQSAARFLVALCPPTPTADPRVLALCATLDAAAVADLALLGNVTVLTSAEIQQRYPVADYYDAHSDALDHIPFTLPFFTALGTQLARTLYAAQHPPYKAVVLDYRRQQLADLAVLALPMDHARPAVSSQQGASLAFTLPAELSAQLAAFNQREGVTLCMTLLTAFQVVLARYSRQTDIVVGTPIANRTRREIEGLIGFFVNTLVLRSRFGLDWSFRALLSTQR